MAVAAIWLLIGYAVGSIPVGLLVARVAGIDIRHYGTGNIGASNVLHNVGLLAAAIVGVASFAQGLGPTLAAELTTRSQLAMGAAAAGSVIGYGWSFLLAFRGGRAVGTATGALAGLAPLGLVPLLALYAAGGVLRRPAPAVLLGLLAYLVLMWHTLQPAALVAAVVIVAAVVVKRFDGVVDDLRDHDHRVGMLLGRLVHDRRPGQRLVGPND